MADSLETLDPELVREELSRLPFVTISGVNNVRSLGLYPTRATGVVTRPNFLFRAGEVSGITEEGKSQLRELGITKIYDLRSDTEIEKYNTPLPEIEGIDLIRVPVFEKEDYSPEVMARRYQLYAHGTVEAFMQLYSEILEHGGAAFGAILKHVRDRPNEGCLFHCTAGKDRTGIMAALLLLLAGVDDDAICRDYKLTTIGRAPIRDKILARLSKERIFAEDKSAALNMLSSRYETMMAFLKLLHDKYGGAENYIKKYVGLSEDDIVQICNNLLISPNH